MGNTPSTVQTQTVPYISNTVVEYPKTVSSVVVDEEKPSVAVSSSALINIPLEITAADRKEVYLSYSADGIDELTEHLDTMAAIDKDDISYFACINIITERWSPYEIEMGLKRMRYADMPTRRSIARSISDFINVEIKVVRRAIDYRRIIRNVCIDNFKEIWNHVPFFGTVSSMMSTMSTMSIPRNPVKKGELMPLPLLSANAIEWKPKTTTTEKIDEMVIDELSSHRHLRRRRRSHSHRYRGGDRARSTSPNRNAHEMVSLISAAEI